MVAPAPTRFPTMRRNKSNADMAPPPSAAAAPPAVAAHANHPVRSRTPPSPLTAMPRVPLALESSLRDTPVHAWRSVEEFRRGMLPTRYTMIARAPYRILITDAPREEELQGYAALLKKFKVKHVVRVCEPTYDPNDLTKCGDFKHHDWPSPDGREPSPQIIMAWLKLLYYAFQASEATTTPPTTPTSSATPSAAIPTPSSTPGHDDPKPTVAIHCRHGLGRAPVLVAVALIELGMQPEEAVGLIRAKRRGAINTHQLQFLQGYQRKGLQAVLGGVDEQSAKAGGFLSMAKHALSRRASYRAGQSGSGGRDRSRPSSPVAQTGMASFT